MTPIIDLTGRRFGKLFVLGIAARVNGKRPMWICRCDCGRTKTILGNSIRSGKTKSCGCFIFSFNQLKVVHGMSKTSEYKTWGKMKDRCYNKNNDRYHDYGGRGIKVCDRWLESFENFLLDMGKKPTSRHSLDRVNNNEDYSPENCRWATGIEQARNKRKTLWISMMGETRPLTEWASKFGISPPKVRSRIKIGWENERAFSTP